MNTPLTIHLVTLTTGHKVLRLEDPQSGLSLERRLDPARPILAQKSRLVRLFEELARLDVAAA